MPLKIYGVTTREKERLEREAALNHHIPDVLIDRLENLASVCYASLLKEFRDEYEDATFKEMEEEYMFIKDIMCKFMKFTFATPFVEVVEKGMMAAVAETNFEGTIRERFIHPFQNFLLGVIIIDHFHDKFKEWFSEEMCRSTDTCVEASWLLSSIFHDRLKPLRRIKALVEFEEGRIETTIPDEQQYIQAIASLYNHLAAGRPLEDWSRTTPSPQDNLCAIFDKYSKADNHGIKSSFALLKHLRSVFQDHAFHPSYIEATLSIAIHDNELHNSLVSNGVFPLDITHFPLPCLLLYCDTIQEWGRRRTYDPETRLVDLKITDNNVHCEVAFDRTDGARMKLDEVINVTKCIQSSGNIEFTFSPRVHVSM